MFLGVAETIAGLHCCGAGIVQCSFNLFELRLWVIAISVTPGNLFVFAAFHLTPSLLPLG